MKTPSIRRNMVTEHCVQGTFPPCTCACPINFDLREFMRLCGIVGVESGYRVMSEGLVFPEIAHRLCNGRCMTQCVEDIDIHGLEAACLAHATKKDPARFSVVPKEKKIAIIGAGVSGMVCALRLAVRGFPVTIFDKGTEAGGTLSRYMEPSIYREEFARQFQHAPCIFIPSHEVTDVSELNAFDAVYVATGANGNDFGLLDSLDRRAFSTTREGWFLGGELTGADPFTAMAEGRVASTSIEKYLLMSGSMTGDETSFLQTQCFYDVKRTHPPVPVVPRSYKKSEVKAEARRCRKCDCTHCYDACAFMQHFRMYPKELEDNVLGAMSPDGLEEPQGYRLIYSCLACGHCGSVCPENINLEPLFMKGKLWLKAHGKMPDQLHAYYLEDFEDATVRNHLLLLPEGKQTVRYLFFPGCRSTGSGAAHVEASFRHLCKIEPESGLLMSCCGIPAFWSGKDTLFQDALSKIKREWNKCGNPELVVMCPTCRKTFAQFLPEIPCISLYELFALHAEIPMIEAGKLTDVSCGDSEPHTKAIFDACASSEDPAMQQAVRILLQSCCADTVTPEELPDHLERARCCGQGGHAYPANPDVADASTEMAAALSDLPYIVYCNNCRNVFLSQGKACTHLLDELFRLPPRSSAPHPGDDRRERRDLFLKLQGLTAEENEDEKPPIALFISDALRQKMDRALLSEENVLNAVVHCEESCQKLLTDDGAFLGYQKIGFVTVWVEYAIKDNTCELRNVYSHRVEIGGVV